MCYSDLLCTLFTSKGVWHIVLGFINLLSVFTRGLDRVSSLLSPSAALLLPLTSDERVSDMCALLVCPSCLLMREDLTDAQNLSFASNNVKTLFSSRTF